MTTSHNSIVTLFINQDPFTRPQTNQALIIACAQVKASKYKTLSWLANKKSNTKQNHKQDSVAKQPDTFFWLLGMALWARN